jgi:hypothetical protein
MKKYYRDGKSGVLTISDPEKEKEILFRRNVEHEIATLKKEINRLNKILDELLAKRN